MSTPRSSFRRRQKPPLQRFKDHFRKFTAFMFSNVGIILLVILYTIGGAFIFQAIEIFEYEMSKDVAPQKYGLLVHNFKDECLQRIWHETAQNIGFFDRQSYRKRVNEILLEFQRSVVHNHLVVQDINKQWSFSGAFLYSLTVITTIDFDSPRAIAFFHKHEFWPPIISVYFVLLGVCVTIAELKHFSLYFFLTFPWDEIVRFVGQYIRYGNISPRSDWGKLVTIVYAIVGMPLFLLYLSNIGDVLAKSFKWIYSKVCLCRICPGVAKRRLIRERRKLRQIMMSKALADMEESRRKKYDSSTSSVSNSSQSASSYYSDETESSSTSSRSHEVSGLNMLDILEDDDDSDIEREIRGSTDEITVPLTVCVFIMISYILWGALLFGQWESWGYLDGSYFCFISLSSIGFGDLVPGDRVITADKDKVEVSFILCAVYLLLGMALIAMCFNLMQEQVIHNIRSVKRAFKACFRCRKR